MIRKYLKKTECPEVGQSVRNSKGQLQGSVEQAGSVRQKVIPQILKELRLGSGESPRPRAWEKGRRTDLKDTVTANDIV